MNNSSASSDDEVQHIVNVFSYIVYSLVMLLGVPGNVLVVWSLMCVRREQVNNCYRMLVINLAVNDIMMLITVPFIIAEVSAKYFPFGSAMCVILYPLQTAVFGAGVFNMVALNVHRFYVISYTSSTRSLEKVTVAVVIVCWLIPTLITAVPYAVHLELTLDEGVESCGETWTKSTADNYSIYLFVVQYVLPLIIIATLNTLTIKRLKRGRVFRVNCAKLSEDNLHAHRRIVKMLIFIVLIFALFGLPGQIMWLIPVFAKINNETKYNAILALVDTFPFMYCVLNPVLFFTYNTECHGKLNKVMARTFFCCEDHWKRRGRLSSQTGIRTDYVATLLPTRASDSQETSQSDGPRYDSRYKTAVPKYLLDKLENTRNTQKCNGSVKQGLLSSLSGLYGPGICSHEDPTASESAQSMPHLLGAAVDENLFRESFVDLLKTQNVNSDLMRYLEASPETAIVEENVGEIVDDEDRQRQSCRAPGYACVSE